MQKLKLSILVFLILGSISIIQAQQKNSTSKLSRAEYSEYPHWVDMMKDLSVNFYDLQDAFTTYFKDRPKGKGTGWKQFKRWEWFMEQRLYPSGNRLNHPQLWNEMMSFYKKYPIDKYKSKSEWEPLGPFTSEDVTGHWNPGIGRINVIARDPFDENILYIGAPAGGLWKTTNEGDDWEVLTDHLPVMGVSAIAVHPINTDIIYIGTGDKDASDNYSIGVLKSEDGGYTWEETGLDWTIYQNRTIAKLLINPENPDILFAATTNGLYKTTDAGDNWNMVQSGDIDDIEFKPGNPNTVYANTQNFYRSVDGGETFTQVSGLPGSSRVQIAVTEANPEYVYFFSYQSGIYRSINSGVSFTIQSTEPNQGSQGWYDLAFAVSHEEANEVHLGEINTWRSTNGGENWVKTTDWMWGNSIGYTHCDIHEMVFYGSTLYVGSDGMICKSIDGGNTWTNLTEGICIRQFYRIGVSKTNPYKYLGGSQDNGTSVYTTDHWHEWLGADGMECLVDHTNENVVYGTSQMGQFYKSTNGGNYGNANIQQPGGGAWVTPFVMHPSDPQTLYVGSSNVRKTTNGMNSWSTISSLGSGNINNMYISESDPNYLYVSKSSSIYKTEDGGGSWDNISSGLPNQHISYIAVHPLSPEIVAVSLSGYTSGQKVYISYNAGETWINFSENLPNIPANCVIFHRDVNNGIYVGMDVGCYYRDNSLDEWEPFMDGLPNVIVNELEIHYELGKIRAGTYGRGLWESDLHPVIPVDIVVTYNVNAGDDDVIEFGESVTLDVTLKNTMETAAEDVEMAISFDGPFVNITDSTETFGLITAGDSITINAAYAFDVSTDVPDEYLIKLITNISSITETWEGFIKLTAYAPIIEHGNIVINDGGNGRLDPGESAEVQIAINNNGSVTANDIDISISTIDPFVIISNASASFIELYPDESEEMVLTIEVDEQTPVGHVITLYADIIAANDYMNYDTIGLQVGLIMEDFESGDFTQFDWEFEGVADWQIDDNTMYEGDFSAQSGDINDMEESVMYLEIDVLADGEISFYKKVSCEDHVGGTDYDYLAFFIDDEEQYRWDGEIDWSQETYAVSQGNHTFKWLYYKDYSVSSGADCAWVDYIMLPPVDNGIALMHVTPNPVNKAMHPDNTDVDTLSILNIGGGLLEFEIEVDEPVLWLSLDPISGNVSAGETASIEMTFDTWGLEEGDYSCNIVITDNTEGQTIVPVYLLVDQSVGIPTVNKEQFVHTYPNPFQNETVLSFKLERSQDVRLYIYNSNGEKVVSLIDNTRKNKGTHHIHWNGKNTNGVRVPEGVYYFQLTTDKSYSGKIILKR